MNEKVKIIFEKYETMGLNIKQMSKVIGISSSKTTKIFSDFPEKIILEKNMLPPWKKIGGTRLWDIEIILKWNSETVNA